MTDGSSRRQGAGAVEILNREEKVLASITREMRSLSSARASDPSPRSAVAGTRPRSTTEIVTSWSRSTRRRAASTSARSRRSTSSGSPARSTKQFPAEHHGCFDAFIASHVIEHIPDPVGLFRSLAVLLRPNGVASFVVPDKRFCLDFFMPVSTAGELLDAHERRAERHSRKARYDFEAYSVRSDDEHASSERRAELDFFLPFAEVKRRYDEDTKDAAGPYTDCHAWHFTPSSFALVVLELEALELIDFHVDTSFPTSEFEFYVTLRQARRTLDEGVVRTQRLELLTRSLLELREQSRSSPRRRAAAVVSSRRTPGSTITNACRRAREDATSRCRLGARAPSGELDLLLRRRRRGPKPRELLLRAQVGVAKRIELSTVPPVPPLVIARDGSRRRGRRESRRTRRIRLRGDHVSVEVDVSIEPAPREGSDPLFHRTDALVGGLGEIAWRGGEDDRVRVRGHVVDRDLDVLGSEVLQHLNARDQVVVAFEWFENRADPAVRSEFRRDLRDRVLGSVDPVGVDASRPQRLDHIPIAQPASSAVAGASSVTSACAIPSKNMRQCGMLRWYGDPQ